VTMTDDPETMQREAEDGAARAKERNRYCLVCGCMLEWEECGECEDGFITGEMLMEEDPQGRGGSQLKRRDLKPCSLCGKGLAHSHSLNFYRVSIEMHVLNIPAIRRQAGLEMLIGNVTIANAMGLDENMTIELTRREPALLCFDCAVKSGIVQLFEELPEVNSDDH